LLQGWAGFAIRFSANGGALMCAERLQSLQAKIQYREFSNWLGNLDSNQDKQSQSLLCYRYTIPQWIIQQIQSLMELIGNRAPRGHAPPSAGAVLLARRGAWQVRN
jgi:hypothetical protein